MSPAPPTRTNCDFCGRQHAYIRKGRVGGMRATICGDCILRFAAELPEAVLREFVHRAAAAEAPAEEMAE